MFLDEATITVHGGKGGDGLVSWRKEKYVDKGGPWGGDGGNGGSVIIQADGNTDTLTRFAQTKVFSAENGQGGGKSLKHGATGDDLILKVPPGTVITDTESGEVISDLHDAGDEVRVAQGGRGGYGNAHFTSSVRQAPDFAEKGEPGQTRMIQLELKLVADVGIIGFPSVGKSTLISVISNVKPKIAEYEFTTLVPNLGVVTVHDRSFVVCDVPGLIEGASEGKGLGDKFLKHIERCGVLIHLLDVNRPDIVDDYHTIRNELQKHSPALAAKREVVVLNKIDLVQSDASLFEDELRKHSIDLFASISAATHDGLEDFLNRVLQIVLEEREKRAGEEPEESLPVLRPLEQSDKAGAFTIEETDGTYHVHGKRIEQIAVMTDWDSRGGQKRFRDIVERTGLLKALKGAGANNESSVLIGKIEVSGKWC